MDLRIYILGRLLAQWFQAVGRSHSPAFGRVLLSALGVLHSRVLVSCTFTSIHVRAYEHRLDYDTADTFSVLPRWVRTLESTSIAAFWIWCLALGGLVVIGLLEGEAPALEVTGSPRKWYADDKLRAQAKEVLHTALRYSALALWTLPMLVS